MARSKRHEYVATIDYAIERTQKRDIAIVSGNRDGILRWAMHQVATMRSAGANSNMRTVKAYPADDRGDPVLVASYFDDEQGLTDVETYASRVHDWHSKADQMNTVGNLGPFEHDEWEEEWGLQPDVCPACDAVLEPQNFYKYNGVVLLRTDGTRRLLGE